VSSLFAAKAVGASNYAPPPPRLTKGSRQQDDIWSTMLGSDAHLLVEARAGTGKSSTCREGMHRLIEADSSLSGHIAYVAFNKSIADEFQHGLPPGARATTMHSAGFAALRGAFPSLGDPNPKKLRGIADRLIPRRDRESRRFKTAAIRLTELCKSQMLGCDVRQQRYGVLRSMLVCLASSQGIDLKGFDLQDVGDLVTELLRLALKETASIDFGDMIWLPVMLDIEFPRTDILFVDEAQDLDPCQHALVTKMAYQGRMIVVGDPRQAIYGFRGADSRSMGTLGKTLEGEPRGLQRLPLTATRRCPRSHVALARNIVPDFESMPGAPSGRWEEDAEPSSVIEPGWMVLSRKNAPLVSLAFKSVARGIPVAIQGRQIGEDLARFVEDLDGTTLTELAREVERYRDGELARLSDLDDVEEEVQLVNDRCECVVAASVGASGPADVSGRIRSLFKDVAKADQADVVLFSSVHRAKGREAERVAIVDPMSMPSPWAKTPEAIEQELNILYVAATRSKHRLSILGPMPHPLKGQ
jgi:DNA helicase-2/ATP-dependent DNA helicase PcrA